MTGVIQRSPAETPDNAPLAIICGGGSLPFVVADAAIQRGRRVVLFPLHGWADPTRLHGYRHYECRIGQLGRMLRFARAEGCRDLVLIGNVIRPRLSELRPDFAMLRILPRVWAAYRGGDDHLLSGIAKIFEDVGFRLLGAHEVAPEILMPPGLVAGRYPTARDRADIDRGLALLAATGPFDVGQAVVVADNHVLAVEASEGTDHMLARIAELRREGRIPTPNGVGVLVKAPKPQQDRRIDLPSIGPRTVEGVARAGLGGIALAAGSAIVAEPERLAVAAGRAGVFVVGIADGQGGR